MADIFNMADTWTNAGTTYTAILMNVTDTASAAGSLLMDLQIGGASRFSVRKDGSLFGPNSGQVGASGYASYATTTATDAGFYGGSNTGGLFLGAGYDAVLRRDAANTLAQRNGVNAQAFRVYNTYTDASNYERAGVTWNANTLEIGTAAAGTGTVRDIRLMRGGTTYLRMHASGFEVGSTLTFATDNGIDIGASGANRPRDLFLGRQLNLPAGTTAKAPITMASGVAPTSPADGDIWFDGTNFKARVGGVTKTFTLA